MTEAICTRRFLLAEHGSTLVVDWMNPFQDEVAWRCDWRIGAPGRPEEGGHAYGLDGVQALLLAMALVRTRLEELGAEWLEGAKGTGLPQASDASVTPVRP